MKKGVHSVLKIDKIIEKKNDKNHVNFNTINCVIEYLFLYIVN